MGKQINYYMEYECFLKVAQKALELGCIILKRTPDGRILQSKELSVITPDYGRYVFFFPQFGPLVIRNLEDGRQKLDGFATASGNAIVEAGFSRFEGRTITRARLYIQSGYYQDQEYIPRSSEMSSVYEKMVRIVKKFTGYMEIPGKAYKEYISPQCMNLIENGGYQII